jgi:2-dehydropantoate 2-reductase
MFRSVAIVGAGAVGGSLVAMMMESGIAVTVVADCQRASRIEADGLRVNGERWRPRVDAGAADAPYDLVIVATKSTQLQDALPLICSAAGDSGVVLSLLNGISSEDVIRGALSAHAGGTLQADVKRASRRVVPAMILGIDAVRTDSGITYLNRGTVHFGADPQTAPVDEATLAAIDATLGAAGIPGCRSQQIIRTLWWKFMINVGINQASAVLRAPYGLFQRSREARELMLSAMDEVVTLSHRTGAGLDTGDLDQWIQTLDGLDPTGKTSMLQDVEAHRPTEVELFSGTVMRLAAEHAITVPVNQTLYRTIRAMEASW